MIFLLTSAAWADEKQTSLSIPQLGTIIIKSQIDQTPALSPPFLVIENAEGKVLKRIDFKLKGIGDPPILHPSELGFSIIQRDKDTPIIVAVASSPGGSDIHFETTIIGFSKNRIIELAPNHIESSSRDALCFESSRPNHFILFSFLWDHAHYDPTRYEATLYELTQSKLKLISKKKTKKEYKDWKGASEELGYTCKEDLIQIANANYK